MEAKCDPGKKLDLGVSKVVYWVVSCGLEEYLYASLLNPVFDVC